MWYRLFADSRFDTCIWTHYNIKLFFLTFRCVSSKDSVFIDCIIINIRSWHGLFFVIISREEIISAAY